ncbi:tellurite resistance TerB family protein, partial [uncultured Desulfobulbus sp.]|uniref:tellurite resistance TerB family protein n=1 Tax=uncultured Desulfobulbus sp. TaxID=239745 RepID=UPI00260ABB75
LGGGRGAARRAGGGGGLALLASLAFAALQRAGQQPQVPKALLDEETPVHQQELEAQAQTIVRAMINAAKADGRIDETEISKIIGKLDDDGLTEAEKNFFLTEANKPMDLQGIVNEAAGSQELAAEVYAASLLAIEVDTPAEQQYMAQLASGLALPQEAVAHIHETLGLRVA